MKTFEEFLDPFRFEKALSEKYSTYEYDRILKAYKRSSIRHLISISKTFVLYLHKTYKKWTRKEKNDLVSSTTAQ